MAKASDLLGTFTRAQDDQRRRVAWGAAASRVATILMVVAIVAIGAVAVRQLWIEWQTAAAQGLSVWLIGLMSAMLVVLFIGDLQSRTSGAAETGVLRQRVQVVRRALLAGDTQLAPLAATQPEFLEQISAAGESVLIGPLRPLTDTQVTFRVVGGASALTFGFLAAFLAALFIGLDITQPREANNPPLWLNGGVCLIAVVLLAIGVRAFMRGVRAARPQPVTVEDVGIRWARRATQPPMHWGDVRAFYTVAVLNSFSEWPGRRIYVLDSGDQVIAWQQSDTRYDHTRDASDRLVQRIVARTGLLLRDLTAAFDQATGPDREGSLQSASSLRARMLAQIETNTAARGLDPGAEARLAAFIGRFAPTTPVSPDAEGVSVAVQQALESAGLPVATPQSVAGRGCVLLLAAVVAFALLAGAAWGLQQAQARYLAGLPARIHAKTPLYADSLAAPDGNWLVAGASASGVQYQGQSYRLSGTAGNPVTSWTPDSYGDVAVQVTARQLGGTQSDGIGLIVRADAADSDYVAFVVSPTDGGWTLWQFHPIDANADDDWHYLGGGDSAAIHTGADATNTLLAITRGQTYVLYVNGVFVGSASDGDPDVYGSDASLTVGAMTTPHQGSAGVYLADGVTEGVFSNFVVYRVQPPTSLWYV